MVEKNRRVLIVMLKLIQESNMIRLLQNVRRK